MTEIEIRFTEQEVAQILWVLSEASDLAGATDALSGTLDVMAERVKVTEAVRRTGVPGTVIFLAIRHGELATDRDELGYDWVDPEEVAALTGQTPPPPASGVESYGRAGNVERRSGLPVPGLARA